MQNAEWKTEAARGAAAPSALLFCILHSAFCILHSAFRVLVGLAVLVAGGVAHGLWTDRWRAPVELERAREVLAALPDDIGSWKGEAYEQDAESLALAGAVAHYSRTFTDPVSGERVVAVLLAGKPTRMVVHRPEHCHRAAGYELAGQPTRCTVQASGAGSDVQAELRTGSFVRDEESGPAQLRVFWTWHADKGSAFWEALDNPRWTFARCRVLYKLYVIRNVAGPMPLEDDPCVRLLGELLPILERALAE
jgi:hypothetical protein